MRRILLLTFAIIFGAGLSLQSFAQQAAFDPHQAFDPFFNQQAGTRYRSAAGQPGPDYWANRNNYQIHARLDTIQKTITAEEIITYTNNSPDSLQFLWLLLDQNRYTRHSRSATKRIDFLGGHTGACCAS